MSCELISDRGFSFLLSAATPEYQRESSQNYRLWRENPNHPSLQFKRVHPREPIYSVRVGIGWRALSLWEDEAVYWFWIGCHTEYDRLLNQL